MTNGIRRPIRNNIPADFLNEFIWMIIVFGRLERSLKLAIKNMHGKGYLAGLKLAEERRDFEHLCDTVLNQHKSKFGRNDEHKTLVRNIGELKRLAKFQNRFVHSAWTTTDNGKPLCLHTALNKKKTKLRDGAYLIDIEMIRTLRVAYTSAFHWIEEHRRGWGQARR